MTTEAENPLESVLCEIQRALDAGLPYAAVVIALSVPDICVTLENNSTRANQDTYARWVQTYLHDGKETPTNRLLYKLRCGVFHNGILSHHDMEYMNCTRVVFSVPGTVQIDGFSMNGAWCWSAQGFCDRMNAAARKWYHEHHADLMVAENLDRLIRVRPNGLSPYVVGTSILA